MGRVRCVLIAGLLTWSVFLPCRAGGGETTSGAGWNDGEMPPVFNPYVEDEAEETAAPARTKAMMVTGPSNGTSNHPAPQRRP